MRTSFLLLLLAASAAAAERLPHTAFGHLPMVETPRVSPDGEHVAVVVNGEHGPTVDVATFGSNELQPVVQLKYGRDRIDWIAWANDERLLVAVSESTLLGGDRVRTSRLFSIRRDGKGLERIERKAIMDTPWWASALDTSSVVSYLRDDPAHVLLELYDERDEAFSVFRVDIENNEFEKLFVNGYGVDDWYANGDGEVVLGVERDKDLVALWHRPDDRAEWKRIHERRLFESETFAPVYIDGNDALVITDHETRRQALWRYDLAKGEFVKRVFVADGLDIDEPIVSHDGRVVGVSYYDDYRVDEYFDIGHADRAAVVKNSFPLYETVVVSESRDGQRMMVLALRDDSPGKFFWLDLEKQAGGFWFSQFPHLEKAELAPVQPFELETGDGMTLHGYLTMPTGAVDGKPPLIVHPHGGPQARDYRYFDPYVQFFANRGYAVLQINFRGSTGFGNDYETAGYREWGMAMQEDVYRAIAWLAEKDAVDVQRACIVGGSYGGYVALTAAFQRPEAFRCHVALAAVSDLRDHAEKAFRYDIYKSFVTRTIGDPTDGDDKRMLDANSPIRHLSRIKAPILLVHGTYDTRVPVQQSRAFYKQARRAGLDIEYVELDYGTHHFDEHRNRLAVFEAMDRFLSEHL